MTKLLTYRSVRPTTNSLALALAFAAFLSAPMAYADETDALGAQKDNLQIAEAELSDETMDEARAGFTDASGMIYRFAVDVRTQIDGAVTFTRQITLDHDASGQLQAAQIVGVDTTGLPTGATATLINNGQGIRVTSTTGATTVLNQTASGALASIIMNTANDQQITQTMNINLVLQNMPAVNMTGLNNTVTGLAQIGNLRQIGLGGY